jgi:hypothetical protein
MRAAAVCFLKRKQPSFYRPKTVERAKTVIDHGAPELQQTVERGQVSVSAAASIFRQSMLVDPHARGDPWSRVDRDRLGRETAHPIVAPTGN